MTSRNRNGDARPVRSVFVCAALEFVLRHGQGRIAAPDPAAVRGDPPRRLRDHIGAGDADIAPVLAAARGWAVAALRGGRRTAECDGADGAACRADDGPGRPDRAGAIADAAPG